MPIITRVEFLFRICYDESKAQVWELTINGKDWEPLTAYISSMKYKKLFLDTGYTIEA